MIIPFTNEQTSWHLVEWDLNPVQSPARSTGGRWGRGSGWGATWAGRGEVRLPQKGGMLGGRQELMSPLLLSQPVALTALLEGVGPSNLQH